jgi:membrane protein YqaA with SNARE-associated domain
MNASDFFLTIFIEHLASATIVPFISSITLEAMALFGNYDLVMPSVCGIAGLVVGCLLNWLLGYGMQAVHMRVMPSSTPSAALASWMVRYGWLAAGLFWLPLASVFLVVLGFFHVSLLRVGIMVLMGSLFHVRIFLFA